MEVSMLLKQLRVYTRKLTIYFQVRKHVLKLLAPNSNDTILDIGCGSGLWSSSLNYIVNDLCSLDINVSKLHTNKKRNFLVFSNTNFVGATATSIPFIDNAFDKIICIDVIEHIPNDRAAISEIYRVLKPSGKLVITTLNINRKSYISKVVFSDHVREYTKKKSFRSLLDPMLWDIVEEREFYKFYSTICWEIVYIFKKHTTKLPLVTTIFIHTFNIISILIAKLDFLSNQAGGGFTILAKKKYNPVIWKETKATMNTSSVEISQVEGGYDDS